ncbi:MAG: 50S ribosomal protein L18 [Candidatus Diapherotrites archaeon]|nr:50S ribosomal protein L18 [Candidatus Diapherotrites archaeon]
MTKTSTYETQFKRRHEKKTNYAKRLGMLKSKTPRIVVRKTNTRILVQAIAFNGKDDSVLAQAESKQLKEFGWYPTNNTPTAYLTGLLCGKRAKEKGVKKGNLDIGFATPVHGSTVFGALKGLIDAGVELPADEKAFPPQERIDGRTIEAYAKSLGGEEFGKMFSKYAQSGFDVKSISKKFAEAKQKILGS